LTPIKHKDLRNMRSLLLPLTSFLGLVAGEMGHWDDAFEFATDLQEDRQFKLYWSHLDDDIIDIGMECNTTGWIAIGLSPNGGMENSDIMMGWVDDDDGSVTLQDRYTGDSMDRPSLDDTDDLTLIEGEQSDGITRIRFQRTRTVDCDDTSGHDLSVSQGTSRVIFAWNDDDGDADEADSIHYHGANRRGTKSVNLWYGEGDTVDLEDDVDFIDLTMSSYSVSSSDTEYACKVFKLPTLEDTHHIVMYEPIIDEGNEGRVHHFQLYVCHNYTITGEINDSHQMTCDDWDTNMPSPDCRYSRRQLGWAIGGTGIYMPEEAGVPIGGDSDFHYAFLEVHYDNPELRDDIVDSSGFRLWHTANRRTYDVGSFVVGMSVREPEIRTPWFTPQGVVTTVTGYCYSKCTDDNIPEGGVTAFASALHSHTAGVALKLRHIRNGVELEPLGINEHYDFDYQKITMFDEEVQLLPGDQFIVECTYDTTERDWIVLSGEGTMEEMCLGYVWVYPIPDFYACIVGFGKEMVSEWLVEAYDGGYWDINTSDGKNVRDLLDDGTIDDAGSIHPGDWESVGGEWFNEMEGAQEMYEKIWNDDAYSARIAQCYSPAIWTNEFLNSTFEDEFGEFEEYCTDSCGCDESTTTSNPTADSEEKTGDEDDDGGWMQTKNLLIAVIVLVVFLVIAIAVIMYLVARNRRLLKAVVAGGGLEKGLHVPNESAVGGANTTR